MTVSPFPFQNNFRFSICINKFFHHRLMFFNILKGIWIHLSQTSLLFLVYLFKDLGVTPGKMFHREQLCCREVLL